ncbi:UDP-glycosyltransferase 74E2-like [Prunus yedoensis var. nudiflora]|uniref:Glycosyltransferase n=1 Tax=Prunus yedoensis var. nudiflora TaxID=2094558 RepID=A0A314UJC2_PRUYE|nr:UDP-glycosyltransferase 74E2-like [Prunus yedoensis var. nudiflora]
MENAKQRVNGTHILVLPIPAQGHINPMLQFSKRLASKGAGEIDLESSIQWLQTILSQNLPDLISKQERNGYPICCLVYDAIMAWALDIAKGLGIAGASFFTQACAVGTLYYNVQQKLLRVPLEEDRVLLPGLPLLEPHDLPSFINHPGSYPSLSKMVVGSFSNITDADWIFCNTFDCLEPEVVSWMRTKWPIKTIGPTLPSMYLEKRLEDDRDYGINLFKPNNDTCIKWLDSKKACTVVYVSFGSVANLGEKQMEELALGLKRSKTSFLWVVRESEIQKLPSNFEEQTSEKGLVVNWCPQLQVLAHRAIGCFMTHCGWNSTLEALSLGVPMVAMPQWTDQLTNAKFVEDEWKVGVRVKVDQGIVTKEEIERCIAQVMEGDRGNEIKRNSMRWRELAKEAVDEGGSSDKNIEEFVAALLCK